MRIETEQGSIFDHFQSFRLPEGVSRQVLGRIVAGQPIPPVPEEEEDADYDDSYLDGDEDDEDDDDDFDPRD